MWGYVLGKPQAITFTTSPRSPTLVADTYMPAAKGGGSTSPVTFSVDASSGAGVCSIDASRTRVTFNAVGTCVIDADQAGDGDYDPAPQVQQSVTVLPLTLNKIVSTDGTIASQGWDVSVSADGNTVLVGGPGDNDDKGAAWVFVRAGDTWTQQGKLVGTAAVGQATEGYSVALSADGNTAVVGGPNDTRASGAVWVFTRANGVWTQQGGKLTGLGASGNAFLGASVAVSADGSTVVAGGYSDNNLAGATWVFTRTNGIWRQQGAKLVGPAPWARRIRGGGGAVRGWEYRAGRRPAGQRRGRRRLGVHPLRLDLDAAGRQAGRQRRGGRCAAGHRRGAVRGRRHGDARRPEQRRRNRRGLDVPSLGRRVGAAGRQARGHRRDRRRRSGPGRRPVRQRQHGAERRRRGRHPHRRGVGVRPLGGELEPVRRQARRPQPDRHQRTGLGGGAVRGRHDGDPRRRAGQRGCGATWAFTSPLFFPTAAAQLSVSHVETQRDGTVTFMLKTSQRGTIDVLASRCGKRRAAHSGPARPGRGCYAFARAARRLSRSGTTRVTVRPGARGRREVRHHTRAVRIDLWADLPAGRRHLAQLLRPQPSRRPMTVRVAAVLVVAAAVTAAPAQAASLKVLYRRDPATCSSLGPRPRRRGCA